MTEPVFTGSCAQCGKPAPALKVHGRWEFDPFCSTVCAKAWWAAYRIGKRQVAA